MNTRRYTLALFAALSIPAIGSSQSLSYPATKTVPQVDVYFGDTVPDPYRWLEQENAPETAKWVEDENKVTFAYLEKIPFRAAVKSRLEKLYNYPRYGTPSRKGEYFTFTKNNGLQNQSVLYIQKGLDGEASVLLDPNKFSANGTSSLAGFARSKDGRYAAYGISTGGSDWRELHVMEVQTRKPLPEVIKWAKVTGIDWAGDGLLQRIRCSERFECADVEERGTQGLLPSHRHAAITGRAGLRGQGKSAAVPQREHH
jgi:prolyl oligopeptidase